MTNSKLLRIQQNHQYSCLSNFLLESIGPHASFVYIDSFSVVLHVLWICYQYHM